MKLTVHTFLTLDGVMQGPGGADEDRSGGFERGGWLVPLGDADMGEVAESWFARADAILLGRNTYEMMRAYWSEVTDPANAVAAKLNHGRKYVASNSLTDADWGDTTVLSGDVIARVADLRQEGGEGELQVHGSALLAQSLHTAGLIDEYRLLVFPVTVDAGHGIHPARIPHHQHRRPVSDSGPESFPGRRPHRARRQGSRAVTRTTFGASGRRMCSRSAQRMRPYASGGAAHPKLTGHHAAAFVIGRRGLGLRARRRASGNLPAPEDAAAPGRAKSTQARSETHPKTGTETRGPATRTDPRQPPGIRPEGLDGPRQATRRPKTVRGRPPGRTRSC